MTKLTDTQLVILSAAAGRDDRAVLPLPKFLTANTGAATTVLRSLIKKGLIKETPATPGVEFWRKEEDGHKIALTISGAGLAATDGKPAAPPSKRPRNRPGGASKEYTPSGKAGTILGLLSRPKGSKITELQKATGWQAHSIRAALTGLRKRGITISRSQDEGATVYRADGA
ncbi:MAG: DUF3489 domain-containing protein [Alphaproteobacteria bacterium]|nr:DUF3489 domain-containing protein [Alphaproteobacteria bacterium]